MLLKIPYTFCIVSTRWTEHIRSLRILTLLVVISKAINLLHSPGCFKRPPIHPDPSKTNSALHRHLAVPVCFPWSTRCGRSPSSSVYLSACLLRCSPLFLGPPLLLLHRCLRLTLRVHINPTLQNTRSRLDINDM